MRSELVVGQVIDVSRQIPSLAPGLELYPQIELVVTIGARAGSNVEYMLTRGHSTRNRHCSTREVSVNGSICRS
jgi:hypothetical protein